MKVDGKSFLLFENKMTDHKCTFCGKDFTGPRNALRCVECRKIYTAEYARKQSHRQYQRKQAARFSK